MCKWLQIIHHFIFNCICEMLDVQIGIIVSVGYFWMIGFQTLLTDVFI